MLIPIIGASQITSEVDARIERPAAAGEWLCTTARTSEAPCRFRPGPKQLEPLGPDFGNADPAFAGHRVEQINPPILLEDRRIT